MYLKVLIVSFLVLLLGALIGFLGFPMLFQELVKRVSGLRILKEHFSISFSIFKSINLKPGSESRQLWQQLPFPLIFKIYVFNVSNPEEVEAGGKPKLEEVGPLVFE